MILVSGRGVYGFDRRSKILVVNSSTKACSANNQDYLNRGFGETHFSTYGA